MATGKIKSRRDDRRQEADREIICLMVWYPGIGNAQRQTCLGAQGIEGYGRTWYPSSVSRYLERERECFLSDLMFRYHGH